MSSAPLDSVSCHPDQVRSLKFSYRLDGADWATAKLRVGKDRVTVLASGMSDAPEDLLDAVISLFYGATISWASWMEEPDYNRWLFVKYDERRLGLTVIHADDADPLLVREAHTRLHGEVDLYALGEAIAAGMDTMLAAQTDAKYHKRWGRSEADTVRSRVTELRSLLRDGPTSPAPQRLYPKVKPRQMEFGGWDSDLADQHP
jgi:hypothetical protein